MARLTITRRHELGLQQARRIAWYWAEQAEQRLGVDCTVIEGSHGDTVEFTGAGMSGTLHVSANQIRLKAHLGLPLSLFSRTIEAKLERALDRVLGASGGSAPRGDASS